MTTADAGVTQIMNQWIEADLARAIADKGTSLLTTVGHLHRLAAECEMKLKRLSERVGARNPMGDEAHILFIPSTFPVITTTRITFDANGTPRELSEVVAAGDRVTTQYFIDLD
jgi:DNA-binding GntR family transcriptional regulator